MKSRLCTWYIFSYDCLLPIDFSMLAFSVDSFFCLFLFLFLHLAILFGVNSFDLSISNSFWPLISPQYRIPSSFNMWFTLFSLKGRTPQGRRFPIAYIRNTAHPAGWTPPHSSHHVYCSPHRVDAFPIAAHPAGSMLSHSCSPRRVVVFP